MADSLHPVAASVAFEAPDGASNQARGGLPKGHIPALDGLRGWAILVVLLHHFTPQADGGNSVTRPLLHLAHAGWVGVDLFFVLSGFLITGILLRTRETPGFFRNFYARRLLRIFPLYYGVLVGLLIVLPLLLRAEPVRAALAWGFGPLLGQLRSLSADQGWLWTYGTNFKIAIDQERWSSVNHFWSLAVEEHFYLVWPLVVFYLSRRALVGVCGLCLFGAPLLRLASVMLGYDSVVAYVMTPTRVDALCLGGLVAVLASREDGARRYLPKLGMLAAAAAVLLGAIIYTQGRFDRDDRISTTFGYSLLAVIAGWLVLHAAMTPGRNVPDGPRARWRPSVRRVLLLNPVLLSLGKYSYGIYVLHVFFIPLFKNLFHWQALTALTGSYLQAIVINALLSVALSWLVAVISYHAFEKHFLRLKRYFEYGSVAAPSVAKGDKGLMSMPLGIAP